MVETTAIITAEITVIEPKTYELCDVNAIKENFTRHIKDIPCGVDDVHINVQLFVNDEKGEFLKQKEAIK